MQSCCIISTRYIHAVFISRSEQIQQQMSSETQIKKPRLFSAKIVGRSNEKQSYPARPMTGTSSKMLNRQELIENIYTHSATQPNRTFSAKALTTLQPSTTTKDKPTQKAKISKKKEEMAEEIMNLKQTVNKLVEELSLQKGKTENMRKKNVKYTKTFEIQFENQKYLLKNSQSHLVAGLKAMYDGLKEKYEEVCAKCELLSKRQNITKEAQLTAYVKILENENKNLNAKIERLSGNSIIYDASTIDQRQAADFVIGELEAENKAVNQKFRELSAKYKMRNENLKDRNTKIAFLQKLIIQKDNSIHYTSRQGKKAQQQNISLKTVAQTERQQIAELQARFNNEIQEIRQAQAQLVTIHNQQLEQMSNQKQARISSLEKENAYLQLMVKELRETNLSISRENQKLKESGNKQAPQVLQYDRNSQYQSSTVKRQINFIGEREILLKQYDSKSSKRPQASVSKESEKVHISRAVKKRRVQQKQIAEIADLVRLRLIKESISPIKLGQFFNYQSFPSKNKNLQHHQKYISMQELRPILESQPFSLRSDDALLLARYLIEDGQSQYVLCDEQNENLREAVKSIIKNLVKDYPLAAQSKIGEQLKQTIEQYRNVLKKTLKSSDPSGSISKKKFLDALKSLGIDCSDQIKDLMLATISEGAFSINTLQYHLLF